MYVGGIFFDVTEEGWVKRGEEKGKGVVGEIFLSNCLSEYHTLFPDSKQIKFLTSSMY